LESQAVKLGIGQCDGVCVKELEEKLQQIQQALDAQDPAGFLDAEEAMLTCVFERAGNQTLMSFIRTLGARSHYYKMVGVKDVFEIGNVALLYDEAAQFVAGATTQDENMALDALNAHPRNEARISDNREIGGVSHGRLVL